MSERFLPLFHVTVPSGVYVSCSLFCQNNPPHKVIPIYFCAFLVDLRNKVAEKIANPFYFFLTANTCTHWGPIFQQRASRPRFVVDLGHWELSLIQRWRAEGMVGFSLIFHLFYKVSSDYRGIKQ